MAITVAATAQSASTGSPYTFTTASTLGHTPATGNLVVIAFVCTAATSGTSGPAGWNHDRSVASVTGLAAVDFYSRIITGSESATYQWTYTNLRSVTVWEVTQSGSTFVADTGSSFTGNASSVTSQALGATATLASATSIAFACIGLDNSRTGFGITGGGTWALVGEPVNSNHHFGSLITSATTALNPTCSWTTASPATAGGVQAFYAVTPVAAVLAAPLGALTATATATVYQATLSAPLGALTAHITATAVHPPITGWTLNAQAAWGNDPLDTPSGGEWSDISDVSDGTVSLRIGRGTRILSSGIEPGTADHVFENSQRHLDPAYTDSDLWPNVIPRRRFRDVATVLGSDYTLHTGFAEDYKPRWSLEEASVSIPTQDILAITGGMTLPASVLDVVTAELGALSHWPMAESIFTGTADDVIGTRDGTYVGNVQPGQQIVPFDARPAPKFTAPSNADTVTPAMVAPISCTDEASFSVWFRWDPGTDVTVRPPLIMLQNVSVPDIPSGGFTSPQSVLVYLVNDTTLTYRQQFRIVVTDGTQQARLGAPVAFQLLDGATHHLVFGFDASAKTFMVTCKGTRVTAFTDTGEGGTTPIASVNVSSVVSSLTTLMTGWGIDYQSPFASNPPSGELCHLAYWDRVLDSTDVNALTAAGDEAWTGDTTDERLDRICDLVGIDAGDRDFDAGTQTCGSTMLANQTFLAYIKRIVATEAGVAYVNGDGKLRFRARPSSPAVVQTFSDDPTTDSAVPCEKLSPEFSYRHIVNTVTIGRENGADQLVQDATSVATFGELSGSVGGKIDTLHENADDARATGQFIIDNHKDPVTYIPSVTVSSIDSGVTVAALLGVEIGDLVAVKYRPPGATTEVTTIHAYVEAVTYDFGPTEIRTTYTLGDGIPA